MTRRVSGWIARCLIAALLFAQVAVAAYACPASAPEMQGMEDCALMAELDAKAPSLCAEHCQPEQQLLAPDLPSLPLAVPAGFFIVLPEPVSRLEQSMARYADVLTLASSPPYSILHCCFRI